MLKPLLQLRLQRTISCHSHLPIAYGYAASRSSKATGAHLWALPQPFSNKICDPTVCPLPIPMWVTDLDSAKLYLVKTRISRVFIANHQETIRELSAPGGQDSRLWFCAAARSEPASLAKECRNKEYRESDTAQTYFRSPCASATFGLPGPTILRTSKESSRDSVFPRTPAASAIHRHRLPSDHSSKSSITCSSAEISGWFSSASGRSTNCPLSADW